MPAGYALIGGTNADLVVVEIGPFYGPGSAYTSDGPRIFTAWSAKVGGTQYEDTLDYDTETQTNGIITQKRDGKLPPAYIADPTGELLGVWIDDGEEDGEREWVAVQGKRGPIGPSGGPVPDMTGVPAGRMVRSLGNNGAEWVDHDAATAALADDTTSQTRASLNATFVAQAKRPVNLRDVAGIDFTGATDSRTALQDAITAAGVGATIEMGRPGIIRCDSGITLLEHQTLVGGGPFLGAGNAPQSEIKFPTLVASQVGITGGGNNLVRNLIIRGPNTGANSTYGYRSTAGSPRFEHVGFYGWAIGCALTDAYYTVFDNCEWKGNKYGLVNSNCYNLTLIAPRLWCRYDATGSSWGYAIDGAARGMNIIGGSVEGYGPSGIQLYNSQSLNCFGTYFESSSAGAGANGIVGNTRTGLNINLIGCVVYLTEHARFMSLTGASGVLNSRGNKFVCPDTSTTTPTAYYMNAADADTIKGSIGDDDWAEVAKVGALYVPGVVSNLGAKPLHIKHPGRSYRDGRLSASATLDFPAVAAGGTQDLTIAVPGAAPGDVVDLGGPTALTAGLVPFGFVSAYDTVTVRLTNITAGAIDPAAATWRASVR